jgi:hypothetical protein
MIGKLERKEIQRIEIREQRTYGHLEDLFSG